MKTCALLPAAVVLLFAATSLAQVSSNPATTSPTGSGDTGEAVVITGSNIKRSDYEGPQAIEVIDREKIDQSGATTVTELLSKVPGNNGGFSENVNNGLSFSPGAAAASLRGLGVSATLVLINGRRVAPFALAQNGTDSFVDLNSIPLSAVDRVEILKEGASAIYGSDAVAGVVNIILKENYSGAEVNSYYGNTTSKDAGKLEDSFASGFQTDRFHLMLTGNYFHQNSIADVDRTYSTTADHRNLGGNDLRSSIGNPGTVFASTGDYAVPPGSNGRLGVNDFLPGEVPDGTIRNRYNFNKDSELTPLTERWGGLLTFGYDITSHIEFFGEASYQSVQTKTRVAPTPADVIVPASNPFNPFGEDVEALWRSVETGDRRDTTDTEAYRYVTGFKIKDLPKNWSADASFLYSESDVTDFSNFGYLSQAKTDAALADTNPSTSLNVFGDGLGINNNKTLKNIIITPRNDGLSYIYDYELKGSGELFDLPAGPVSLAVGGEYRDEFLRQRFSEPIGAVIGYGGAGSEGRRSVRSLFVEGDIPITSKKWNIPLLRDFELTLAERYDDYSDFGESTKPKFGFKVKPLDWLLLRGTYAEGFRAPSLPQLFTGTVSSFDTVVNPRTGEAGDVPITTGGNPGLKPESSYYYSLGGVIDVPFVKNLDVGLNYYHLEQRNLIVQPNTQDVVDGKAPGVVTYDSNDQITNISELFANLGDVVVQGVDLDVHYKLETKIGTFTFDSDATYVYNRREAIVPGAPLVAESTFSTPDFIMVGSLFYKIGGFEAGISVNYIDSYDDDRGNPQGYNRTIGSWTTLDLQASYEWIFDTPPPEAGVTGKDGKTSTPPATPGGPTGWRWWLNNTKLTIGCKNIGDVKPPFSNIEEGYDTATADPNGRFIYASLRKKFW